MLLAIDLGTSRVDFAVFGGEEVLCRDGLPALQPSSGRWLPERIPAILRRAGISTDELAGIAVSSVAPMLREPLVELCRREFQQMPEFVKEDLPIPIPARYDPPEAAGADRLANAVAASRQCGVPVVVFDFGTATTIDVVAADGAFVGGMILPGLSLALRALHERAPHLPPADAMMSEALESTPLIGGSTAAGLQSGLYHGAVAQAEGLARRLRDELGPETPIMATGGLSHLFEGQTHLFTAIDRDLTLHGIRMIWEAAHSNR